VLVLVINNLWFEDTVTKL